MRILTIAWQGCAICKYFAMAACLANSQGEVRVA